MVDRPVDESPVADAFQVTVFAIAFGVRVAVDTDRFASLDVAQSLAGKPGICSKCPAPPGPPGHRSADAPPRRVDDLGHGRDGHGQSGIQLRYARDRSRARERAGLGLRGCRRTGPDRSPVPPAQMPRRVPALPGTPDGTLPGVSSQHHHGGPFAPVTSCRSSSAVPPAPPGRRSCAGRWSLARACRRGGLTNDEGPPGRRGGTGSDPRTAQSRSAKSGDGSSRHVLPRNKFALKPTPSASAPERSATRAERRGDYAWGRRLVRRNAPMAAMESSCVVIV